MLRPERQGIRVPGFQSAPGREAGRCHGCAWRRGWLPAFQSAPGREAGRCQIRYAIAAAASFGFNPRPAVRPGDAAHRQQFHVARSVSIRARP